MFEFSLLNKTQRIAFSQKKLSYVYLSEIYGYSQNSSI